jgi:hypothetical protein
MKLLRELTEAKPVVPSGWNVGQLADFGVLLSTRGFSIRFSNEELNSFFDAVESGELETIRVNGQNLTIEARDDGINLIPEDNEKFPNGIVLDLETLKELGVESFEHEPESEFEPLSDDDTIEEGVKLAYKRKGRKIKRGYRVTSGFRKGRVVSKISSAFKPRASASLRTKLRLARRRKTLMRILKGKITRRRPTSRRVVSMNKQIK